MSSANQIYRGSDLKIGVVGQAPIDREGNIYFEKIAFEMWDTEDYDAIFISV